MNKTVNINLGGTFFHIDEDAYLKLSRYFEAIKKYLSDSEGKDEIIRDIEIRIAELFTGMLKSEKQVISMRDLDQVIEIMGEPEDYRIDDETPKAASYQKTSKKLYRDTEGGLIGGVLAGIGHYLGIDKVWLRLFLALLLVFYGTGVLLYIILWIIMPEAKTTSEKLEMKGEPVNISNIEKKVREEFENISDKVNNIDYEKYKNKAQSGAQKVGNKLSDFFSGLFSVIGKIIGIFIIIFSVISLGSLIIGLATLGSTEFFQLPWMGVSEAFNYTEMPIWVLVILFLLAIGIPLLALLILGFRILISNSKPLSRVFKYSLLGVWIISLIALTIIGVRQATEVAFEEKSSIHQPINLQANDTLEISITTNPKFESSRLSDFRLVLDESDKETIYSSQVSYYIRKTNEAMPYVVINKFAGGNSLINAKKRAEEIRYNFEIVDNKIKLDDYLLADLKSKYRNQNVEIEIYIPEGRVFHLDETFSRFSNRISLRSEYSFDHLDGNQYYRLENDSYKCLDCVNNTVDIQVQNDSVSDMNPKTRLTVGENGEIIKK